MERYEKNISHLSRNARTFPQKSKLKSAPRGKKQFFKRKRVFRGSCKRAPGRTASLFPLPRRRAFSLQNMGFPPAVRVPRSSDLSNLRLQVHRGTKRPRTLSVLFFSLLDQTDQCKTINLFGIRLDNRIKHIIVFTKHFIKETI